MSSPVLSPPTTTTGAQRGFTLIELLVSLALVGMLLSVIPPLFTGSVSGAETHATARDLSLALRQMRGSAIAQARETTLTLDLENGYYSLSNGNKPIRLNPGLDFELFTAESEVSQPQQGSIRFYPDGSSTGGKIKVSDARRAYTINVDWLTGKIELD